MKQELLEKHRDKAILVLMSSGTTGEPKAIVHDFEKLKKSFTKGKPYRTLAFFPMDHMAGINTLFRTMESKGCLIIPQKRDPEYICKLIQDYEIELLPTTPTFLNLMLMSEAYKRFDLSSLKLITYGSEPMNEITLKRLIEALPNVKFKQTYGLSEIGVIPTQSKDGTLWVRMGEKTRVRDGMLEVKTDSTMLGYINAPDPFTSDGYFKTGDRVDQDGEYFRILGRESDMINVAGHKVNPVEVENVIMELDNIREVIVYKEKSNITGSIVCAKINPVKYEWDIAKRIKKHCRERLEAYKVPVKIDIDFQQQQNDLFKKQR
jgi:acyl-coenzyme A synthetase/AMP-(fatty) acid ligase